MSRPTPASKRLGLLALFIYATMLLFTASQAGAIPSWRVNGNEVTEGLSPAVTVQEVEGKDLAIKTEILKIKVEFLCTGLQAINVVLKPKGVVAFKSGLKYSGCITKLNGSTSGQCEPIGSGGEPGVIVSRPLNGALVLHEGEGLVIFEGQEEGKLASTELPIECPLGTTISLFGKLTLKDPSLAADTKTHLAVEGPLTEMWVNSNTVEHKATVQGSVVTSLAGVHAGLLWSGSETELPKETNWFVKGVGLSGLSPLLAVNEIEGGGATLSTKISGTKVEITCNAAQLSGVKLQAKGAVSGESRMRFSECATKLNEKASGACEPSNQGIEPGAIASQPLKGLLIWHEGFGLIRMEPMTGETLAVIETSGECAIGSKIPLLGKVTLKDTSLFKEAETHLLVAGPLTELWAVSKTEEHKTTLGGSGIVRLASTHAGAAWSGFVAPPPPTGWRVKGAEVTSLLSPSVSVKEVEGKDLTLLTEILKIKVEFLCTGLQTVNVKLKPESVVAFESGLKYTGCITKLNGTKNGNCEPIKAGGETGVIGSKLLKGALSLHEGASIVMFEALEGETLATVEMGAACPIGTKVPVLGKISLKDGSLSIEAETHLGAVGPLTELWSISKTEEHKSTAGGSIVFGLAGVHAGLLWGGSAA